MARICMVSHAGQQQPHTGRPVEGWPFFIWENEMGRTTALRLVDTRTLDREQWLEVRRGGIGSSDAAAEVGLCPYKSKRELWMEKTGRAAANGEERREEERGVGKEWERKGDYRGEG